jgi:hypothetical protein
MAIIRRTFWGMVSALVAGVATFFGLSLAKAASARTIETRLADVSKRLELLEKEHNYDILRTLYPHADHTSASDTKVSQFPNWRNFQPQRPWNDWRDFQPQRPWNDWRDFQPQRPWNDWRDFQPQPRWRDY